jgi:phosphoserine phosphatase RsbU/P
MPVLVKLAGSPAGQLIELKDDETTIGRLPECAIVLDPRGVSRRHAPIRRLGKDYYITDLRSRNRTKVNGREVAPEPYSHLLRQGDRINIGGVEFIYYRRLPEPRRRRERANPRAHPLWDDAVDG